MIADVEGDYSDLHQVEIPDSLPILAVRTFPRRSHSCADWSRFKYEGSTSGGKRRFNDWRILST